MKKYKKFTLIELIVVISIIGILATLLLPSLGKIKEKSLKTKVIAKMSVVKVALNSFYTEYYSYPISGIEDELKGIGSPTINNRKLEFFGGDLKDEWRTTSGLNLSIFVIKNGDTSYTRISGDGVYSYNANDPKKIVIKTGDKNDTTLNPKYLIMQ